MTKLGVISVVLGAASPALAGPREDQAAARARGDRIRAVEHDAADLSSSSKADGI
jgi:hypothetical protein